MLRLLMVEASYFAKGAGGGGLNLFRFRFKCHLSPLVWYITYIICYTYILYTSWYISGLGRRRGISLWFQSPLLRGGCYEEPRRMGSFVGTYVGASLEIASRR